MSAAVQRLYAVQEQASDPLTIPAAPVAVPRPDLLDTEAVYRGAVDTANLIGFIRDDGLVSGDLIARTRGNASSPADIKRFTQRCDALTWLARSVDGVVPRKKWQRKTLAAAGLLACLTAPAVAQSDYAAEAVGEAQQPLARPWVRPVADGETPLQAAPPRPMPLPEPPKPSLPPPAEVLLQVGLLREYCPGWQIGTTPAYETEAHVCRLLAGKDDAWGNGATTGSWMTAAAIGGMWFFLRLPDWLLSLVALVRRRRAAP